MSSSAAISPRRDKCVAFRGVGLTEVHAAVAATDVTVTEQIITDMYLIVSGPFLQNHASANVDDLVDIAVIDVLID